MAVSHAFSTFFSYYFFVMVYAFVLHFAGLFKQYNLVNFICN